MNIKEVNKRVANEIYTDDDGNDDESKHSGSWIH